MNQPALGADPRRCKILGFSGYLPNVTALAKPHLKTAIVQAPQIIQVLYRRPCRPRLLKTRLTVVPRITARVQTRALRTLTTAFGSYWVHRCRVESQRASTKGSACAGRRASQSGRAFVCGAGWVFAACGGEGRGKAEVEKREEGDSRSTHGPIRLPMSLLAHTAWVLCDLPGPQG